MANIVWEVGILYYQQEEGITTVSKITSAYDPTGKSILLSGQHHLCRITLSSYMPERLFSHSLDKPVSLSEADTQNRTENWRLETSDFTTKLYPHIVGPYTGRDVVAAFPMPSFNLCNILLTLLMT